MAFRDDLTELVDLLGGKQEPVAERVGVTQPTVSRWLKGVVPSETLASLVRQALAEEKEKAASSDAPPPRLNEPAVFAISQKQFLGAVRGAILAAEHLARTSGLHLPPEVVAQVALGIARKRLDPAVAPSPEVQSLWLTHALLSQSEHKESPQHLPDPP